MTARTVALLLVVSLLAGMTCQAEPINWYSLNATNLTSAGAPMSKDFSFELGVFKDGFVPTAANTAQWASNWVPAQRTAFNVDAQRFGNQYTVNNNNAPFIMDTDAYVWGFQGGVASSEWILFRNEYWIWPSAAGGINPGGLYWNANDATAILGTLNPSGSPFLMQSAAVANVASPPTSWSQWQAVELGGESLNGPNDDPDKDGTPNQLEFVFGTPPKQAGAPPQTPVTKVDGHLQITIPRRIDHSAVLVVEVSSDLTTWNSGPGHTEVVSNTPAALVVRDLTPQDAAHPRRFMRLKTGLPTP